MVYDLSTVPRTGKTTAIFISPVAMGRIRMAADIYIPGEIRFFSKKADIEKNLPSGTAVPAEVELLPGIMERMCRKVCMLLTDRNPEGFMKLAESIARGLDENVQEKEQARRPSPEKADAIDAQHDVPPETIN